jgi:hypothetical protein
MKTLLTILVIALFNCNLFCQNEQIVQFNFSGTVPSLNLTALETTSANFSGLSKISGISPIYPHVSFSSTDNWPSGSWGRGYQTEQGMTPTDFFAISRACHPMMRRAAEFSMGHLHLYLYGHNTGNSLTKIKQGIDYILSEQIQTGGDAGGFIHWLERAGQFDIDMSMNYAEGYETSYAIQALSEYYLSGINYRRPEVFAAIILGSTYLKNYNWWTTNSNLKGLGVWALSEAYKVTNDCGTYTKITQLANDLVSLQADTNDDYDGMWHTGGEDEQGADYIYHDTKIGYHMMTTRGLIEAFNVIPSQDEGLKNDVCNAIKRSVNHVINYRLHPNVQQ